MRAALTAAPSSSRRTVRVETPSAASTAGEPPFTPTTTCHHHHHHCVHSHAMHRFSETPSSPLIALRLPFQDDGRSLHGLCACGKREAGSKRRATHRRFEPTRPPSNRRTQQPPAPLELSFGQGPQVAGQPGQHLGRRVKRAHTLHVRLNPYPFLRIHINKYISLCPQKSPSAPQ